MKYICVYVNLVFSCLGIRVTGDDLYLYLGLLFQEGDENKEIGR